MRVLGLIWLRSVVDKLAEKHSVHVEEVEEVFRNAPVFRKIGRGHVQGEDLYAAMGQTDAGRYLIVFFVQQLNQGALVVSARDMAAKERRQHGKA